MPKWSIRWGYLLAVLEFVTIGFNAFLSGLVKGEGALSSRVFTGTLFINVLPYMLKPYIIDQIIGIEKCIELEDYLDKYFQYN